MPKFKTKEELTKWCQENIANTDDGEFVLKPLEEAEEQHEAARRGNASIISDSKKFKERATKSEAEVEKLKTDIEKITTELNGLKSITGGDAQKTLQELNQKNSELTLKMNSLLAENNDLQKKTALISDLEQKTANLQGTINRNKILSEMRTVAAKIKVPQSVIDNDLELYVDQFDVDESGKIFSKGDVPKTVENCMADFQKSRPHWMPTSEGAGASPGSKSQSNQNVSFW